MSAQLRVRGVVGSYLFRVLGGAGGVGFGRWDEGSTVVVADADFLGGAVPVPVSQLALSKPWNLGNGLSREGVGGERIGGRTKVTAHSNSKTQPPTPAKAHH